jgi:hypothetical protein
MGRYLFHFDVFHLDQVNHRAMGCEYSALLEKRHSIEPLAIQCVLYRIVILTHSLSQVLSVILIIHCRVPCYLYFSSYISPSQPYTYLRYYITFSVLYQTLYDYKPSTFTFLNSLARLLHYNILSHINVEVKEQLERSGEIKMIY